MTHQPHDVLDTVQGRSLLEGAEERGYVEPAELEALALELDLGEDEMSEFAQELEAIGLEIGPPAEEAAEAEETEQPDGRPPSAGPATACSSSWPMSGATSS